MGKTKAIEGEVFWCEQCKIDIRPQNVSFHRYDRVHNVISLEKDPRDLRTPSQTPKNVPSFDSMRLTAQDTFL